ncbi:AAC-rich mRNA clone AAC11 protein [Uranotaenia lowii]|uniref:AAC-rich mRNA clone AAC11 protein n=1 Tax=Uranotaenia lowii TaxID=190385 RepID=UPI002478510F|nr:AAC-rich mRNA clone AAC11 protein [Uranotaenia lowii]XP_055606522.1 AAC-rich mRNA clone AAC11 protein [Uranotaenia lowii]XP_055606523.1 AAC-rich mRNA clone AAC11 protein [Uranotaenia lowii]XP_055606525.1 AAC-rich mRNA clone AAC11 protein [Uranotaenia lowii]XP_055606526.1 AAC-rich mRNA clone AAC11 protein [Uranotaenia lowii]XP_055606527.1 AAC-rich mRNA clone AAC11 protein [Uranotaenia lowii]XP_055606528.1 AAC-rich mRNA clone AAC11 protein [Uranotaenia lowii]XP_055606529.1 AAC-rich mRNA clo
MNSPEFPTSTQQQQRDLPQHDFPYASSPTQGYSNGSSDYQFPPGSPGSGPPLGMGGGRPPGQQQQQPSSPQNHQQQQQQQDLTIDGIPNNFSHRRSRASRTFKNPPQPHMCIREKTIDGKEVFINVLSWTRIANPDNPDAPIPLYGGMKVGKIPPGSPRTPPLVYAVMASPEVLKKAGRKCPDTPERMNLVDLMCEFVEAMNPTLHLSRKPEILKDRDLSGELKDVWNAVQACRDKGRVDSGPPENLVVYTEFGPDSAPSYEQQQQLQQQQYHQQQQHRHQPPQPQHQQGFQQQQSYTAVDSAYQLQQHHLHQQSPPHGQQYGSKQSAITYNSTPANLSVAAGGGDSYTEMSVDAPDCGASGDCLEQLNASNSSSLDELTNEMERLTLSTFVGGTDSGSKSNGLTLPTVPTGGGTSPTGSANTTPASAISPSAAANSIEHNLVPVSETHQKQSPTSPTTTATATIQAPQQPNSVSPTAPAAPATPQKESKASSGHNFFPMFRSSKSSNSEKIDKEKDKDKDGSNETQAPDTPVKSSSKKSGLNFFRRNKSESKNKEPSTPTKQQQQQQVPQPQQQQQQTVTSSSVSDNNKINLALVDESLLHHHHHHHHHHILEGQTNGNGTGAGELIVENSATIVAK